MKPQERKELLETLKTRFEKNMGRHKGIKWGEVENWLENNPATLRVLSRMDETGGEPDVVSYDRATATYTFVDCSAESPAGRRSLCYDREALDARKEHKPADSAVDMARAIGIELLTEAEYRDLQKLGEFDRKTSSWIRTPSDIRSLGGALFCDRRYGKVFTYHNGAESYFGARGFRGSVRLTKSRKGS